MARRKPINPFYVLLLLAGCAFAVTACAYGVMTVRQLHRSRAVISQPESESEFASFSSEPDSFSLFVDEHGVTVMMVELALLAVGTVGAIGYDQHLDRKQEPPPQEEPT